MPAVQLLAAAAAALALGLALAPAAHTAHRAAPGVELPLANADRPSLNGSTHGSCHCNDSTLSTKESLALES